MDITEFMSWFISQVVTLFTKIFSLLDSVTFSGTSLLKVTLTILILSALIPILLTIGKSGIAHSERSGRVKGKQEANDEKNGWI